MGMKSVSALCALCAIGTTAQAQQVAESTDSSDALEEILVSGSRLSVNLRTVPGSITVLDEEALGKHLAVNSDLAAALAYEVPGYGTSSGNGGNTNFGQTLRGRSVLVLIDGVQVSTPLRDGARDVRAISGSMIERVEVLRGSSALYGNGGGGGVINYITRGAGQGATQLSAEVGTNFSLTHPGDSWQPSVNVGVRGGADNGLDYIVSGSYESVDSFYDADGKLMPTFDDGGIAGSDRASFFGKTGYSWGNSRLQASVLWYDQGGKPTTRTINGNIAQRIPARAERISAAPGIDQGTKNTMANVVYTNSDVFGSNLRVQAFYQDYENTFSYTVSWPQSPGSTVLQGGNSQILGDKQGVRIDVTTPLAGGERGTLLWGVDVVDETTSQRIVQSGYDWVPKMDALSVAPFLQAEIPIGASVVASGGVRYDDQSIDVDGFTTLFTGLAINGGSLDYSQTTYNLGLTWSATNSLDLFAGFSQGFSLADLGRILRASTRAGQVQSIRPESQVQDKWEIGARGTWERAKASIALFYNESELGVTYAPDPNNSQNSIVLRQPEEIYGVETTLDWRLSDQWRTGGSLTWLEGKRDANGDGDPDTYLNGVRIPPLKATVYLERDILEGGLIRVQGLYSGARDRFPGNTGFFMGEVHSYFLVDLLASLPFGPGRVSLGINNALNRDYYTSYAEQFNSNPNYIKAEGASARISYSVDF